MTRKKNITIAFAAITTTAFLIGAHIIMGISNETAILVMQKLYDSENEFQSRAYRDVDADGKGEYALLSEIIALASKSNIFPDLTEFEAVDKKGYYASGYWRFTIYLPQPRGQEIFNSRDQDAPFDDVGGTWHQEDEFFIVAENDVNSTRLIVDCTGYIRLGSDNIKEDIIRIINLKLQDRKHGAISQLHNPIYKHLF